MKKVWVLRINSESGDDYGCWVYPIDKKPNKKEINRIYDTLSEENEYLHNEVIESDFIE